MKRVLAALGLLALFALSYAPIPHAQVTISPRSLVPSLGGLTATSCGVIATQTTAVSTAADTNETTGFTFDLPANTLVTTGRGVHVIVFGKTGATANAKTVRIKFGADTYNVFSGAVNASDWFGEYWAMRTGLNAQWRSGRAGFGATSSTTTVTTLAVTETAPITIAVTEQNGVAAAADITITGTLLECF